MRWCDRRQRRLGHGRGIATTFVTHHSGRMSHATGRMSRRTSATASAVTGGERMMGRNEIQPPTSAISVRQERMSAGSAESSFRWSM
jgi:hypothetical protein